MLDQKVGGKLLPRKGLLRSSRGMSYVEVLVALTVMSVIVLLVPATMLHSTKATNTIKEKTVVESLTRTQIEYLKSVAYEAVPYDPGNPPYFQGTNVYVNDKVPVPSNETYFIDIGVVAIDPDTYQPLDLTPPQKDGGIQQITVKVYHLKTPYATPSPATDRPILTTAFYKLGR